MAEFPSLPLFTDAYLGDTTHLTTTEHGAYLLLLMAQWRSHECRLPGQDDLLARFCKMSLREWLKIREIIAPFFHIKDGFWVQLRLKDEAVFVREKRKQNIAAGKLSALKSKGRHSTDVITDVSTDGQREPNQPTTHTLNPERKEERLCTLPVNMVITDSVGPALEKSASETPKQKRGERLEAFLEREGVDTTAKAWGDWARAKGMAVSTIDATMENFRDWWRSAPAAKGVKADWPATWRGWVRRELEKIKEKEKRDALFKKR